jgi:hypothetical protein
VGRRFQVEPKGAKGPLDVFEVQALGRPHQLALPPARRQDDVRLLDMPCTYMLLEEKFVARKVFAGRLVALSLTEAEMTCPASIPLLTNVKLSLRDGPGGEEADVYAKVVEQLDPSGLRVRLRFTSIPPTARGFLEALVANATPKQAPAHARPLALTAGHL